MEASDTRSSSTIELVPPWARMASSRAFALGALRVVSTTWKPSFANFWATAPPTPQRMPTGRSRSSSARPWASLVLRPSACHLDVAPTTTATGRGVDMAHPPLRWALSWALGCAAAEELQQQPVDLGGVLVGRPVAGLRDAMQVEAGDGGLDLADQQARGPERGVVALAPQQADPPSAPRHLREIAEQRAAAADFSTIEARSSHAVHLDVDRLLGDARRIAQHVDQQVVAADLAEEPLVAARLSVAADGPLPELAHREAAGRDEGEVAHPRPQPPGHVGRDRGPEREAGEAQRSAAGQRLEEQGVHQIEVLRAGGLARHRSGVTVRRVVERVDGEAGAERVHVADPVLPRAHAAVEEHEVGPVAGPVHGHARRRIGAHGAAVRTGEAGR